MYGGVILSGTYSLTVEHLVLWGRKHLTSYEVVVFVLEMISCFSRVCSSFSCSSLSVYCVRACVCVFECACTCVCMCVCVYMCVCMCVNDGTCKHIAS